MRKACLLAIIGLLCAAVADCQTTDVGFRVMHIAGRVVAVWYPTTARPHKHAYTSSFSGDVAPDSAPSTVSGKRVPLVVFSHGDFGCGTQSIAFTEELARHGYVVAAPDHADASICHIIPPVTRSKPAPQPSVFKPETWDDKTFADRRADIEAVIDGLVANSEFARVIDSERIGAAGHSLGGYTVVGMAGGWPSWTDSRIRAVLAFSPYVMPFQIQKTLGNVHVPLMYQGGTLDVGITPFLTGSKGAYAEANPPVYFMELRRAGHLAWVNCGRARTTATCIANNANMRLIDDYGIAFLNRYLKGTEEPTLDRKAAGLADYVAKRVNP